ncbi:MAG: amylo-alpha-1,6-glucosidase [Acidobacteria bacterium]|nr:amylo-alpha-1,6-glucosidase [Acidobacteriota bacterium]
MATAERKTDEAPPEPLDIRGVLTIKHDRLFLLCDRYGDIGEPNAAALGLYFRDTRFLSRWELLVDGRRPVYLHSEADRNYSMLVQTTLPLARMDPHGGETHENVSVSRHRWLENGMRETIRVQNFGRSDRTITLEVLFHADFLDLFEVRGFKREKRGRTLDPVVGDDAVTLAYEGLDGVSRTLEIRFEPRPKRLTRDRASFRVRLPAQSQVSIEVSLTPRAGEHRPPVTTHDGLEQEYSSWRRRCTRHRVSNVQLQRYLDRAILDLRMMQTDEGGHVAIDAGIPWFSTLFGRDALITSYQTLGTHPELAKGTLRTLARYQGEKVDDWREEEPGKILHEIRKGELAACGEIPHTPYYGSIDATPLWLIVYGHLWRWTGDRRFAEEMWPHALRALEWCDRYGDMDGDGFLEYRKKSAGGLDNQGWKDSREGIVHADGSLPEGPIALCEVQGYAYAAKIGFSRVARALGHVEAAEEAESSAAWLKAQFNRDFWMPEEGYYAVALDGDKRQVASITSNPGHCLWTLIADDDKAARVAKRLMSPELASGWGIRTLSAKNPAYDPIGYHTGSVWPHDNAIIAHGLKLYGFDEECIRLIDQLSLAGSFFRDARFPELFCGFSREDVPVPVEYPVACRPQAWATGAPLLMMRSYAGMRAEAPSGQFGVVRPQLPFWLERAEIIGMMVGDVRLDLLFTCHNGVTGVQVTRRDGDLDVVVRY